MAKAKGANGAGVVHRAIVVDNDRDMKTLGVRWECTCRRNGQWRSSSADAARGARRHETRSNAKTAGPQVLRELLRLG